MYPTLKTENLNYTAIAFHALKRLPPELVDQLKEAGQWEDVLAWCGVAAVEGYENNYDFRATYNAAQRYIYQALKASGYHRQSKRHGSAMQFHVREIPFEAIQDDDELLTQVEIF